MKIVLAILLLLARPLGAQERVDLTTPIVRTATTCTIDYALLSVRSSTVVVGLVCGTEDKTKTYDATTTPTGLSLLTALNKANLTTRSLVQRLYDRLILDGVLVGTVAGTVP